MSPADATSTDRRPRSVFLSYASQDREAARLLRDSLPAYGLDVWYDESDLTGGDAWDQKIRRQIRECDFFMPVISATTEVRSEGYFRREWRLAVERTLDMADDHTFLLPVVLDDTQQVGARVPEKFLTVQWSRVPNGQPTPAFEALCRRLAAGEPPGVQPSAVKPPPVQAGRAALPAAARRGYPEFPKEEAGQKTRFWFQVIGWALQWAWVTFNRLPTWIRWLAYAWLAVVVLAKGCSSNGPGIVSSTDSDNDLSPATERRIKDIAAQYQGSRIPADIAKLGLQIAREVSNDSSNKSMSEGALLAIPFAAPSGDSAAQKIADSTFAQVYGRVVVSHRRHVGLSPEPLPSLDPDAAIARGRANHSTYVLYGAIDDQAGVQSLSVKIVTVKDRSTVWSQSYPVTGADATKIAAEVDSKVPDLTN